MCPICGKAIRAKSNFYAHLKVHRQQASREAAAAAAATNTTAATTATTTTSSPLEINNRSTSKRQRQSITSSSSTAVDTTTVETLFAYSDATPNASHFAPSSHDIHVNAEALLDNNNPTAAEASHNPQVLEPVLITFDCTSSAAAVTANGGAIDLPETDAHKQYTFLTCSTTNHAD